MPEAALVSLVMPASHRTLFGCVALYEDTFGENGFYSFRESTDTTISGS